MRGALSIQGSCRTQWMQVPRLVVHQTPAMETWSVLRGIASSVPMTVAAVPVKSAVRTVVFKAAVGMWIVPRRPCPSVLMWDLRAEHVVNAKPTISVGVAGLGPCAERLFVSSRVEMELAMRACV